MNANLRNSMTWLLRALTAAGIGIVTLAIYEHPRIADDWYLGWQLAKAGTLWNFAAEYYLGWSGRVVQIVLIGISLSSETARHVFQILTVACFLLFSGCVHYLGTGEVPRLGGAAGRNWLLTAAVLWLGLPVVNETIVQSTGAATYLWPATAGLLMLCLFRAVRDRARSGRIERAGWGMRLVWLVSGTVVGTCNEQLFAGMAVVLAGWGWLLWRGGTLRSLPPETGFGVAGLILGMLVLVGAPGNYIRLSEPQNEGVTAASMLIRYAMYLGGAYFGLGTGDTGRALWLGIAVIALGGTFAAKGERGKDAAIWLAGSVASLAPMLPLVNYASPRTTFLPVTLLVIAVLCAFPRSPESDARPTAASWVVALSLAMLVAIDGLVGWAGNRSLASEMALRVRMVQAAADAGRGEAVVPYLATMPSRLTAMLNPEHDLAFVQSLARHNGLQSGRHDDSTGAPRPQTLNTLKALKNSF